MDLTINTNTDFDRTKSMITDIIKSTIDNYDFSLSTNLVNNLAVHLSIAIIRIKSNNYIPLSNSQIASYKQDYCYPYAKVLCERLAEQFKIDFPEAETSLVSMYLNKNQKLDFEINSGFDLLDSHIFNLLQETMNLIYDKYHHDYRNDDKLIVAIGLHLEPAIERLLNGQLVENPLKDKIMERHPNEFNYSRILNDVVTKEYHQSFDDDELAFIALHFVVANNRIDE